MAVVSMKQFLEAGVHFGHQTKRWNPKMRPFIFGARNGIHIIDLQKSLRMLKESYEYIRDVSSRGNSVLFVGTKQQAKEVIREEAIRCHSYFINERWLGGLMTNFNTIKASVEKMKNLEEKRGADGLYEGIIKKEAMKMEKKRIKLDRALGGIQDMRRLPGVIFVIDCKKEKIALLEAQKLKIPIVAVVDTNCDPDNIDYIIPGNDDAIRAIRMFTTTIANAVLEGRAIYEANLRTQEEEKPARHGKTDKASSTKAATITDEPVSIPTEKPEPSKAPAETSTEPAPKQEVKAETAPKQEVKAEPAPKQEVKAEPAPKTEVKAEPAPKQEVKAEPASKQEVKAEPGANDKGDNSESEPPASTQGKTEEEKKESSPSATPE